MTFLQQHRKITIAPKTRAPKNLYPVFKLWYYHYYLLQSFYYQHYIIIVLLAYQLVLIVLLPN